MNETQKTPFRKRCRYPRQPQDGTLDGGPLYVRLTDEDLEIHTVSSSPTARPPTQEYRVIGIDWHTAGVQNSCHLDGFLSGFVRRVRQTNGDLLREVKWQDRVAEALLRIAKHTLQAKNAVDSERIKDCWLEAILQEEFVKPMDVTGREEYSVYQHLMNHAGMNFKAGCACGKMYIWSPFLRVTALFELYFLQDLWTDEDRGYTHLAGCSSCGGIRVFMGVEMLKTSWVFIVKNDGNEELKLNMVPRFLNIPCKDTIKNFKLVYLSFTLPQIGQAVGHKVSLHLIHNHWYVHDGMETPSFRRWPNDLRFDKEGAQFTSAVYFLDPERNSLNREVQVMPERKWTPESSPEVTRQQDKGPDNPDGSQPAAKKKRAC